MMTADCKNIRSSRDILKQELDRMMNGVKELEAYENLIGQITLRLLKGSEILVQVCKTCWIGGNFPVGF